MVTILVDSGSHDTHWNGQHRKKLLLLLASERDTIRLEIGDICYIYNSTSNLHLLSIG